MVLRGYVYDNDGLTISTRAMHTQIQILSTHTDNIANFGVPGYQKKRPVVTSFAEYLGPNAVDSVVDTEIGRLRASGMPLDTALNSKGYFQRVLESGAVELTRDGRFHLDAEGWLRSVDGKKILSTSGEPLRFSVMPKNLAKEVKISQEGDVQLFNVRTGEYRLMGRLGVVNEQGTAADVPDIRQGYVEDSNVFLQEEYVALMPLRREFEANRQMFILQNDALSRMIQELGRAQ